MRKLLIGVIVTFVLSFPVARTAAGRYRPPVNLERKTLKAQQKQESKALKLQDKYQKQSWKASRPTKAARVQAKHRMQRQRRALRQQQKDDRQDLKDRERMMKENARHPYSRR